MKKILLLATTAMLSMSANAQWTAPVAKGLPLGDVVSQGQKVRLLNVEYGAFLGGANAWGTQTSLITPGLDYVIEQSEDGVNYKLLTSSGAKAGKYLFRDNTSGCFIDMGSQNKGFNWTITPVTSGTGYYTIQSPQDDPVYGEGDDPDAPINPDWAIQYFGWSGDGNIVYANVNPAGTYLDENGDEQKYSAFGVEWAIMSIEDAEAYAEAIKPYHAAMDLKKVIDQAKADYPSVDCSKAEAVFNNTNSTVEELEAAKKLVSNAIAAVHTAEVLDGASADNPIDGTELITNADFSTGDISGWTNTFVSGTTANNCGYQGAEYPKSGVAPTIWEDEETGETGESRISKFIEAWANNVNEMKRDGKSFATVGDAKLCQTIYGLPAGKYKLSCDAISVQQWDATQNPVTGVQLYVIAGEIDTHEDIHSANEVPNHTILNFIHTGGDVELGLRTQSATANWIAADNFKLMYYGAINENPYKALLDDLVASLSAKYPDMDEVLANNEAKTAFATALQNAKNASDNEGDEYYQNLQAELDAAGKALTASVNAYAAGAKGIEEAETKARGFGEGWEELSGEIFDKTGEWKTELEAGELADEDAAVIAERLSTLIANYVSEHCTPGTDVTILLNNPGFTKDFSGWTMGGAGVVWQDNYGNGENIAPAAENMEAPLREDGLAEKWHAKFTMTQTIKNMPRGLYTLSCQGFNRHDDGENDAAAELYAVLPDGSIQTAPFADIDEYATEESLFDNTAGNDADPTNYWRSDAERNGKWAPNSMTGAAWHFMNKSDGENYDYVSKFNIIMTEAGDLTVGARCEYEHQWVIFDNFRIIYQGNGPKVYVDAIQDAINNGNKAIAHYEEGEEVYGITAETNDAWLEIVKRAEAIIANPEASTEDDCIAIIKELNEGRTSIDKSGANLIKLAEEYAYVNEIRGGDCMGEDLSVYLEEVYAALNEDGVKKEADVDEMIEKMNVYCGLGAMENAEYESATEDEPVDVSAAIDNTKAIKDEAASTHGWTNTGNIGTYVNENKDLGTFEIYNQETFNFTQKIGLKPGYYRLKVQGFHRNGWSENIAKAINGMNDSIPTPRIDEATGDTIKTEEGVVVMDTIVKPFTNDKNAMLYAGEAKTPLLLINSDIEAYNEIPEITGQTWPVAGVDTKFPNSMAEATKAFENDLYQNVLQFQVGDEGAKGIAIGIKNVGHKDGDWTIMTNWQIEYLGKNAPQNDPTTAIAGVSILNNNTIYDLTGRQVNKAVKGIYILNGKKVVK